MCGANLVPGTKVCNLLAQKSIWKGVYLPARPPSKVRTAAGGVLLPASTTPPHAQASWSLRFFPGVTWSPPSPSTVCARNKQVLPGAVLVGLQFQAAVAQGWFCSCSPPPGLPEAVPSRLPVRWAVAALTCWPGTKAAAGLEGLKRACALRQLCQASLGAKWHQWHSPTTALGVSCSCGAEQPQGSGILPAPAATSAAAS